MQAMTPEQDEQWQAAINPLDYLDYHALSLQGREESTARLAAQGVPGWAAQLRIYLISRDSDQMESWQPRFGLHSEAALIGIQIQYPYDADLVPVYQRLFVRFVAEALRPLAEWGRAQNDLWRVSYPPLVALYEHCVTLSLDREEWAWLETLFQSLSEKRKSYHAYFLALELLTATRYLLDTEAQLPRDDPKRINLKKILWYLNALHQWRSAIEAREAFSEDASHNELIASAYLTALEAECPPPDWLPEA